MSLIIPNTVLFFGIVAFQTVRSHAAEPLRKSTLIIYSVGLLAVSFLIPSIMYRFALRVMPGRPINLGLRESFIATGVALIVGFFSWLYFLMGRLSAGAHLPIRLQFGTTLWTGILITGTILFYITIFMSFAYPEIPEQYGGGRPRLVRLLVTKEARSGLEELDIPFRGQGQLSDTVTLVYEGEDQYILRSRNGYVVRVRKDLVVGSGVP